MFLHIDTQNAYKYRTWSEKVWSYLYVEANDDFQEFVDAIPTKCRLMIASDSCHSGGLIEQVKEQIGESTKGESNVEII